MSYQLRLSKETRRKYLLLPGNVRHIARHRLFSLFDDPQPEQAHRLGDKFFFMIIGAGFRMVWRVHEHEKLVDVLYIGPKPPNFAQQLSEFLYAPAPPLD